MSYKKPLYPQVTSLRMPPARHSKDLIVQVTDENGNLYRSDGEFWHPITEELACDANLVESKCDKSTGGSVFSDGTNSLRLPPGETDISKGGGNDPRVGDITKLWTRKKTDVVEAINSWAEGGHKIHVKVNDFVEGDTDYYVTVAAANELQLWSTPVSYGKSEVYFTVPPCCAYQVQLSKNGSGKLTDPQWGDAMVTRDVEYLKDGTVVKDAPRKSPFFAKQVDVGDPLDLETKEKTNLVGAVNEVYQAVAPVLMPTWQDAPSTDGVMQQLNKYGLTDARTEMRMLGSQSRELTGTGHAEASMIPIGSRFLVAYVDMYNGYALSVGFVDPETDPPTAGPRELLRDVGNDRPTSIKLVKVSETSAVLFYIRGDDAYPYYKKIAIAGDTITLGDTGSLPSGYQASVIFPFFVGGETFVAFQDDISSFKFWATSFKLTGDGGTELANETSFAGGEGKKLRGVERQYGTNNFIAMYDGWENPADLGLCNFFLNTDNTFSPCEEKIFDYKSLFNTTGGQVKHIAMHAIDNDKLIVAFNIEGGSRNRQDWWIWRMVDSYSFESMGVIDGAVGATSGQSVFVRISVDTSYFFYTNNDPGWVQSFKFKYNEYVGLDPMCYELFSDQMCRDVFAATFESNPNKILVLYREQKYDKWSLLRSINYTEKKPDSILGMATIVPDSDQVELQSGPIIRDPMRSLKTGMRYYVDSRGRLAPTTYPPYIGVALTDADLLFTPQLTV